MASYVPPKKGAAFVFYTALTLQADTKLFQANPTLAPGDVKVSKDGAEEVNLATLPDPEPDGGVVVRVQLSAEEMNADSIIVRFSDAAGAEWCDQMILIQTAAQQIDDLAATGAKMDLVDAPNAMAVAALQSGLATSTELGNLKTHGDGAWATATGFAVAGDAMTLTADYDAAKTAAQGGDEMTISSTGLTAIAAAVWDRLTTALTTAGSTGKLLVEKLALIVTGSITLSSPVASSGNATTIQGDSYNATDKRALEWTVDTSADLSGATIAVILHGGPTFEAELVGDDTVRLELTAEESASITAKIWSFSIVATQADDDVITLVRGRWQSDAAHEGAS